MGDYFGSIFISADSKEALMEEIEYYRQENEKLNPRFKIYSTKIVPDPEEVTFVKGKQQMFDVTLECDITV